MDLTAVAMDLPAVALDLLAVAMDLTVAGVLDLAAALAPSVTVSAALCHLGESVYT